MSHSELIRRGGDTNGYHKDDSSQPPWHERPWVSALSPTGPVGTPPKRRNKNESLASVLLCRGRQGRFLLVSSLIFVICTAFVLGLVVVLAPTHAVRWLPSLLSTLYPHLSPAPIPPLIHVNDVPLPNGQLPPVTDAPPPSPPPSDDQQDVQQPPAPASPPAPPTPPTPPVADVPKPVTPPSPAVSLPSLLNGLPVVSSYHRCDLLDWHHVMPDANHTWSRKPDWNYADTGHCLHYDTSTPSHVYLADEERLSRQQDQAYFTVHHVTHQADGADLGGHFFVLHENCYRRPYLIHTDEHAARLVDNRWGPTALEVRVNGTELHTAPMRFIDPSRYAALHLAIMRQGSQRRAVVTEGDGLTGQVIADKRLMPADLDWPGPVDEKGHRPDAVGVMGNWTERIYGVDVCMYEADYAVAQAGVYDVRLILLNVDYEDFSQIGHRRWLHRAQNAVLYHIPTRVMVPSPNNVWPHPLDHSLHPALYAKAAPALDSIILSLDDGMHFEDDHDEVLHSTIVRLPHTMKAPGAAAIGRIRLIASPGYDGRWVNVTATRQFYGVSDYDPQPLPIWWDGITRRRIIKEWTVVRPPFFFCAIQDPSEFDYLPYTYDPTTIPLLPPPPPSPPTVETPMTAPAPLLRSSKPVGWEDISDCLSGKRVAFLGDSQTRTLISRIASIFMASDFKFVKQKFAKAGQETPVETQWECVVLSPRGAMAAHAYTVGAPLHNDTFQLCYYPVSFVDDDQLLLALTQDPPIDMIVVNSGQHAASTGWSMAQYGRTLYEAFAGLERRLAPLISQWMPHLGEGAADRFSVPSAIDLPPGHWRVGDPSPALRWMQAKLLWWSSTMYAHDHGQWPYLYMKHEHRPGRILSLFNEVSRGFIHALGIDQLDITEGVYLTFKDCASDGAHGDFPFFDIFSARIMEAIVRKLQCKVKLETTTS